MKFSVLGHLTLPLRYMNENHGMHMSFDGFEDEVAQVFADMEQVWSKYSIFGKAEDE